MKKNVSLVILSVVLTTQGNGSQTYFCGSFIRKRFTLDE